MLVMFSLLGTERNGEDEGGLHLDLFYIFKSCSFKFPICYFSTSKWLW